jgi:hypothetical protein
VRFFYGLPDQTLRHALTPGQSVIPGAFPALRG